jgi:hypothetical protein
MQSPRCLRRSFAVTASTHIRGVDVTNCLIMVSPIRIESGTPSVSRCTSWGMAVTYRFRNSRDVSSIPVPGSGIQVQELKAAIVRQRSLGDERRPVELVVFDAASGVGEQGCESAWSCWI